MDGGATGMGYSMQNNYSQNTSLVMLDSLDFTPREWGLVIGLSLMILCVIFGNVLTLTAIAKHRPLQTPPVYLIASLAVADLMVGLMVMPLSLTYEVTVKWRFGNALCDFWISLDVLCCTASILNLCVIALDRYWAITKPLEYKQKRTSVRMLSMIAVVWIISLVISTTQLFGWRNDRPDPFICMISQSPSYTIFSTFGAFFIPMSIMLVVYTRIFVEARKRIHGMPSLIQSPLGSTGEMSMKCSTSDIKVKISSLLKRISTSDPMINDFNSPSSKLKSPIRFNKQRRKSSPGIIGHKDSGLPSPYQVQSLQASLNHNRTISLSVNSSNHNNSQFLRVPCSPFIQQRILQRRHLASAREQKAVKTLAIITGTFLICWMPFFITALVLPFCQHCSLPALWKSVVLWLGYFNSMINPILYTKFNKDFKDAFSKLLSCPPRRPIGNRPSHRGVSGERQRLAKLKQPNLNESRENGKLQTLNEKRESCL